MSSSSSAPAHCFQYLMTTGLGGCCWPGPGTVSGDSSARGVESPLSHTVPELLPLHRRILTLLLLTSLASASSSFRSRSTETRG